ARTITYGIDALADVQAHVLSATAAGSRVQVEAFGARTELDLPLVGRFNVQNALAAIGAGIAAGGALDQARTAPAAARPVRGGRERVDVGQPFSVIVDYAHTPASLEKVLALLRPLTQGRLIAVFGSAGERDREKRPRLAEVAAKYCDLFVITQEDPRLEDPDRILREIEAGVGDKRRDRDYLVIPDRAEAIAAAIGRAAAGGRAVPGGPGP